jgi:hypothetical protein
MIPIRLREDLNIVLAKIAQRLDLDETRYKNANEKYVAVSDWLVKDGSLLEEYSPEIYPQGSFKLGTIVKPLTTDEYDIDLVCELKKYSGNPQEIKDLVGRRLKENQIYTPPMLEEKNRCWRLIYKGDFHLDILPARQQNGLNPIDTTIEIPDKELKEWTVSNPKGYAEWFAIVMAQQFDRNRILLASKENKSIEEVPDYQVKTTLQQVIQLMKRNRDIVFNDDQDDKPNSIIIATLAALSYSNQSDLFETLLTLLRDMPSKVTFENGIPWVKNPVNQEENFADKWEKFPARKEKFMAWVHDLQKKLDSCSMIQSIEEVEEYLEELFGESVTQFAVEELKKQREKERISSISVPKTVHISDPNKPWKE